MCLLTSANGKQVKIESMGRVAERTYKVKELTSDAAQDARFFNQQEDREMTVAEYFSVRYSRE